MGTAVAAVGIPVVIVVVANGCTDGTAARASATGAHVIALDVANVGAARAAGMAWAMSDGVGGLWLASTDADSQVPPNWLEVQCEHAAKGVDLVLGDIDLTSRDRERNPRWVESYASKIGHVHGANLGVRASVYEQVGGFRPLTAHEDVDLVTRLRASGVSTAWSDTITVTTSARTTARAPAGVSADLARESMEA